MSTADKIAAAKNDIAYHAVLMTTELARAIAVENGISFDGLKPSEQKDVIDMAFAMSSGHWIINGDAIVSSSDGMRLLDGRKRILAAAHFETCFPALQVFGVASSAATTIGEHRRRTASMVLRVSGVQSPSQIAAAAIIASGISRAGHADLRAVVPQSVVPRMVHDFPGIVDAVASMQGTHLAKTAGAALVAAVKFLADGVDPELSKAFFDDFAAVDEGGGSVLARDTMVALGHTRDSSSVSGSKARRLRIRILLLAWNAFMAGRSNEAPTFLSKPDEEVLMAGVPRDQFSSYYPSKELPSSIDRDAVRAHYQDLVDENAVTLAVKTMEPAWAVERLWLNGPLVDGVRRNRALSTKTVTKLARDMVADRWQVNGQTVKFSPDWELLDGQHRLKAVATAGVSVPALIAMNVDPSAFSTFDLGRPHRFAEILKAEGAPSPNDLQGAVRLVWQHQGNGLGTGVMPSNSEMLNTWNANRDLAASLSVARDAQLSALLPRSVGTAMHYLFSLEDKDAARTFFASLASGEQLGPGSPILALRQRLISMRAGHGLNSERVKLLVVVKAWTAWRENRSMDIVKARQNDRFPGIYGGKR